MMTCRELIDFLWMYLSDELPADRRREFDAHLSVCPHCVDYLRGYETTIRLGREAFADPDAPVPGTVPDELVEAILAARRGS